MFEPSPERAELLFADRAAEPPIEVYQQGDIRWLGFGGRAAQSAMSLACPESLVLPYTRAMLLSLLFVSPRRVLNLGLGSGSFHRFFAAHLPDLVVSSVEQDGRVLDTAQRWFQLDPDETCHVRSAGPYLAGTREQQDIIFCDIQSVDAGLPEEFHNARFYRDCHANMTADGVLALNTLSVTESELIHMLGAAWEVFTTLALVEVPDHRNVVVFATCTPAPPQSLLAERISELQRSLEIDLSPFFDTLRILDRER